MSDIESIKDQLRRLGNEERAELAQFLIESLDPEPDPEAPAAWDRELGRRVEEIKSGCVTGIPAEDVPARLRGKYP